MLKDIFTIDRTIEAYPRKLEYPGGFNPAVEKIIKQIVQDKYCIHLFSGSSQIGDIRVDFNHPNSNFNMNVYDFCMEYGQRNLLYLGNESESARGKTTILLLDPNYSISRKELKLKPHGIKENLSGNVFAHKILNQYIANIGFDEILLLDYCSPKFQNYIERYWWRVKTGGWQNNRTLTWYEKTNNSIYDELFNNPITELMK